MTAIVALLIAVDPIGLGRRWPRRWEPSLAVAVALAVSAVVAMPVLDALDLSPEGFWIAAGIVLLVPGLGRLLAGTTIDVAGPAAPLVAMALATRDGRPSTLAAALAAGAATFAASRLPEGRWTPIAERVIGALMVVIAFDLVRDGVIAV